MEVWWYTILNTTSQHHAVEKRANRVWLRARALVGLEERECCTALDDQKEFFLMPQEGLVL